MVLFCSAGKTYAQTCQREFHLLGYAQLNCSGTPRTIWFNLDPMKASMAQVGEEIATEGEAGKVSFTSNLIQGACAQGYSRNPIGTDITDILAHKEEFCKSYVLEALPEMQNGTQRNQRVRGAERQAKIENDSPSGLKEDYSDSAAQITRGDIREELDRNPGELTKFQEDIIASRACSNEQAQELLKGCEGSYEAATRSCVSILGGDEQAIFTNLGLIQLGQVASQLAPALTESGGIANACSNQKTMSMILTALSTAYLGACTTTRTACMKKCKIDRDFIDKKARIEESLANTKRQRDELRKQQEAGEIIPETEIDKMDEAYLGHARNLCIINKVQHTYRDNYDSCENYAQYVQAGTAQTLQAGLQFAAARSCEKETASAVNPFEQFCQDNPNAPGCGVGLDCNDETQARNNPECLCQDPEQQRTNPVCNPNPNLGDGGQVAGFGAGTTGVAAGLGGDAGLDDLFLDSLANQEDPLDINPVQEGALGQDGGGSSAPQALGGGGGAPFGKGGKGGNGKGPYNTDVLRGTASSRGGGGGYGGGGRSFGGYGGSGSDKDDGGKSAGLDLSKFLPGAKGKRGLAGINGPGGSGITGPLGPSIWEKVSRRYKKVRPFLKP